jgi:hypothetical protein
VQPLRAHLALTGFYIASRASLYALGVRFSYALDWMWLADPADLRDRLAQTLLYFHAFPPGMDALTGIVLKLGGNDASTLALSLFWMLGVIVVNALFLLGRAVGLSIRWALVFAVAFTLTPAAIYFEHLFHYEWPVTTLLCLAALLFHRALTRPSRRAWTLMFLVCALIGFTRSTFHLAWLASIVLMAVTFSDRAGRRVALTAAIAPLTLLIVLYAKNLVLFGEFAASTFGPASYTLVTVGHLPADTRDAWIKEGRLSPFAAISVYAPPREYAGFFATSDLPGWPPQLTRLDHQSVAAANFNHWWLLEVHRKRREDAMAYLRDRPFGYLHSVGLGLRDLFRPSTAWHPRDRTAASPHHQHRQVLGTYERWYNAALHTFPVAPFGVYALLPGILVAACAVAFLLRRSPDEASRARAALLVFCVFQVAYVVAASSMLTYLESSRYRFQIEPMIWVVTVGCLVNVRAAINTRYEASARGVGFTSFHIDPHAPHRM